MNAPRQPPYKRNLTTKLVERIRPRNRAFLVWDTLQHGFVLRVEPTGFKSFKFIYSLRGKVRWYSIGPFGKIGLAAARRTAIDLSHRVTLKGEDPQAQRRAARTDGSFGQLADKYLEHAKKRNRSWPQARKLVERHLFPKWSKLQAVDIRRADVRALVASIEAPIVANQTLAAASAIFTWAIREELLRDNPCRLVERNPTRSRERVLNDAELPLFWRALDDAEPITAAALRVLLLTGQRPGEIAHMRREHLSADGWTMPGTPEPRLGWSGTKNGNTHRVWLPKRAQEIITWLSDESETTGFVFAGPRGRPIGNLDEIMREICKRLGIERCTPHDLRRTFSTRMMSLGFGRDCLNRVTNHREGGIASVYDRHQYAEENRRAVEATAARLLQLAEGGPEASNVVALALR